MKKKSSILLVLLLITSLVFSSCNTPEKETTPENNSSSSSVSKKEDNISETSKPTPKHSDDEEIILAGKRHLAPGEEDGYYCSAILYVWEPLIRQNNEGEPTPCLAKSWEMSEDGKEWTIHLQENVTFHDGEEFNADAVIANFDRMKLGVKKSSYYPLDIDSHYPGLKSYEKIDNTTIKLIFTNPSPTQPYRMVNFGSAMYSPKNFTEDGNFNGMVMGTGPFKMIENAKDNYVLLERNDNYWGEPAKAKTIRVRNIPDVDTRYSALKSGEIHGTLDLDSLSPALAEELKKDNNFATAESKSTMIRFLNLNGTKAPFDDPRMKEAVSLALNRQQLVDVVYSGYGTPTTNILNYSSPFYQDIPVVEDLEKAKSLSKEVLGDERVSVVLYINAGEPMQKTEAEMMVPWLAEIGLDVEIQPVEYSVIRENMKSGSYDMARVQQGLSNSDASTIFSRFMVTTGDHNQNYSLGYDNAEVNKLMTEMNSELDIVKISEYYNEIQKLSTTTFPVIPLFNDVNVMGYSKDLAGYNAEIYGLELAEVHWA